MTGEDINMDENVENESKSDPTLKKIKQEKVHNPTADQQEPLTDDEDYLNNFERSKLDEENKKRALGTYGYDKSGNPMSSIEIDNKKKSEAETQEANID